MTLVEWLKAIGFEEKDIYRDDADPSVVPAMAQRFAGKVVLVTGASAAKHGVVGMTKALAVEVDKVFAAALEAGATATREPRDEDYGGRGAVVRDPEGNLWSFGTYRPEGT